MNYDDRQTVFSERERARKAPAINAPWIVLAFIGVFSAIHLLQSLLDEAGREWFTLAFAFTPARYIDLAQATNFRFPGGAAGDVWSFVSHMFLHGDVSHLVINSVWMLIFGSVVARRLGPVRFITFSAICAAMGALAHLMAYWGNFSILVGASGAISGQMAGAVRLMFSGRGRWSDLNNRDVLDVPVMSLWETLTKRRPLTFILVWMAVNLVFGLIGMGVSGSMARIAWEAHVGGFVGGLLLFGWISRGSVR